MAIRLRNVVKFPARVIAEHGIRLRLENGAYLFDLDYSTLEKSESPPGTAVIAYIDQATGLLGAAYLPDLLAFSQNLQAISDAETAANKIGYWTGAGSYALTGFTAFARSLVDDENEGDAQTTLGVKPGVNVQEYSPTLDAWSGKTPPVGDPVGTTDAQTLTGKTINGSDNTLTNVPNSALNVGTGANQLVALGSDGKLPAVDGSKLTGLPGGGNMVSSIYDPRGVAADAFNSANHIFTRSETGSVSRVFQDKGRDILDIRDFLASDGSDLNNPSVNLKNKFNNAMRALRDKGGGILYLPEAVLYAAGIKLFSGIIVEGRGITASTIRAPASTTDDILLGYDQNESASAYDYFGASVYDLTKGSNRSGARSVTLDGNFRGGATSGPVVVWGHGTDIQDVMLYDSGRDGLRTEWTDGAVSMEGTFQNIKIDTARMNGWRNRGPHDSYAANIMVIDASQASDSGYAGILNQTSMRFFNPHVWHRSSATNRCYTAFQSGGSCEIVGGHLEGCRQQLRHENGSGVGDRVIGCYIYAPTGSAGSSLVVINGNQNQHIGCRYATDGGFTADVYAIQIGDSAAVAGNLVTGGYFSGFKTRTPFNFWSSAGVNRIDGIGYADSGGSKTFGGTVNSLDSVEYFQSGTSINYQKPFTLAVYANDSAASAAGIPIGGLYFNSTVGANRARQS